MLIEQILYPEETSYELAEIIKEKFGAETKHYKPTDPNLVKRNRSLEERLPSGSVFLWSNKYHHHATFLSDKKLVLVDYHTDMYNTLQRKLGKISYANWAYWRLKIGEVHLVIPDLENFRPEDCVIPKGREDYLHLYSVKNPNTTIKCISDGWKSEIFQNYCVREVKPVRELKEMDGKVQLSVDLDFLGDLPDSSIDEVVRSVPEADTIDFWVDGQNNREEQYKVCLAFLERQQTFNL